MRSPARHVTSLFAKPKTVCPKSESWPREALLCAIGYTHILPNGLSTGQVDVGTVYFLTS